MQTPTLSFFFYFGSYLGRNQIWWEKEKKINAVYLQIQEESREGLIILWNIVLQKKNCYVNKEEFIYGSHKDVSQSQPIYEQWVIVTLDKGKSKWLPKHFK